MDIKKPQLVKVEAFVHFFQLFIGKDVLQHLRASIQFSPRQSRAYNEIEGCALFYA